MNTVQKKSFKDYYADEEFRKKHLEKLKERVECECGFETSRCNLSRHKKSHTHTDRLSKKLELKTDTSKELKEMRKQIRYLIKELDKLK